MKSNILAGRYKVGSLLGKGAMGVVCQAEDTLLGGTVAVKMLNTSLTHQNALKERFKFEARTCAQLGQKSIHIVRVTDYGINEDDVPFYVMEHLYGKSLSEIIHSESLTLSRFISLARQICFGLQCAHQGILIDGQMCPVIHRDIKPSNIMVSQNNLVGELVKILDFGIATFTQEDNQTKSYMGTLPYSSPEQLEAQNLDARSDIYSLGVLMFEMLTGDRPLKPKTDTFKDWYEVHSSKKPETFTSLNKGSSLPKSLENLVMSCLEKSPNDRPESIEEILAALQSVEDLYVDPNERISQAPETTKPLSLTEKVYTHATWVTGKPCDQKITFLDTVCIDEQEVPVTYVMLPKTEILEIQVNRFQNKLYKNSLCTMSPHPTLMWITGIYSKSDPYWLKCFLDLKSKSGVRLCELLIQRKEYKVLFFELGKPSKCAHLMTVQIDEAQLGLLKQWLVLSRSTYSVGTFDESKRLLKKEFEKLKSNLS